MPPRQLERLLINILLNRAAPADEPADVVQLCAELTADIARITGIVHLPALV